jgi:light-independent protochlorophyllide reductase subunit B
LRALRGVYEGPGCHGILRVGASMKGVHALLRAHPEEHYFPSLYAATTRDGNTPPVSLSPVWDRASSGDYRCPGDPARDLQSLLHREEVETVILARSESVLLSGEEPPTSFETLVCDWESPGIKEHEAADLALFELVRSRARLRNRTASPTVNLFSPPVFTPGALAEAREVERLLERLGIGVNARLPLGAKSRDLKLLAGAWANVVLYRETGESAARYLQDEFGLPTILTPPLGISGTGTMLRDVGRTCSVNPHEVDRAVWSEMEEAKLPWYARLAPPETFAGRRVAVFGDFTRSTALGHTLSRELGLEVTLCGTYLEHLERDFLFHARAFAEEAFVSDDPDEVGERIEQAKPDLVIGTMFERRVAEGLGVPFLQLCPPVEKLPFTEVPLMGYRGAARLANELDAALAGRPL